MNQWMDELHWNKLLSFVWSYRLKRIYTVECIACFSMGRIWWAGSYFASNMGWRSREGTTTHGKSSSVSIWQSDTKKLILNTCTFFGVCNFSLLKRDKNHSFICFLRAYHSFSRRPVLEFHWKYWKVFEKLLKFENNPWIKSLLWFAAYFPPNRCHSAAYHVFPLNFDILENDGKILGIDCVKIFIMRIFSDVLNRHWWWYLCRF